MINEKSEPTSHIERVQEKEEINGSPFRPLLRPFRPFHLHKAAGTAVPAVLKHCCSIHRSKPEQRNSSCRSSSVPAVPAAFAAFRRTMNAVLHGPSGPYPTSEYEHSSIPATVKKIFNLKSFLTKRDAWAGTFDTVITRNTPRTDCPETLPEPIKLREAEAKDDSKLSEFQEELVQMAAVLCGDHKKENFPHKLVENMTVSKGVEYVKVAFKDFLDECERAKQNGADEYTIVVEDTGSEATKVEDQSTIINIDKNTDNNDNEPLKEKEKSKSFAAKFFSCIVCNQH